MLRHLMSRAGTVAVIVALLGLGLLTTSCGGGGGQAAKPMVLLEFLFVDRALNPTAPTGTENLPRNAQILFVFSELADPGSVNPQSVQLRFGPTSQSVPQGSFSVDGNAVRFDPTVTAQGQPNPFGFAPVTQYIVDVPNFEEQTDVVRNIDNDPNLETFFSTFVTSDGFLRELDPPEVQRVYSIPDREIVNPITKQWPANGICAIEFSEPMDPASFVLGDDGGPNLKTSIDVRWLPGVPINDDDPTKVNPDTGVGLVVPGYLTWDAAATTYFFNPTFSFGTNNYVFTVQVFQSLKDLSGNLLVNPRSFGPYTSDGTGIEDGVELKENFDSLADYDGINSDADWGFSEEGICQGVEITSREAYIFGYNLAQPSTSWGEYFAILSPFVGAALNGQPGFVANPATSLGRRVMWAFADTEMGPRGSVTAAGWGPDSNATFAAIYPNIILRCGFQKANSMNLSPSFSGNYEGNPTVVYTGEYQVPQAANIGNTTNPVMPPGIPTGTRGGGCNPSLAPLYNFTGFEPFPELSTFFEWEDGDSLVPGDRVFLFDASVQEGDTWQQLRGWFAFQFPCAFGLIGGFPQRRMYTTYEDDEPNPPYSFAAGIFNPEPSLTDTAFTITRRISRAQTLFYTDGFQPPGTNSNTATYGKDSDYQAAQLSPQVQEGGAFVTVEYNACDAVQDRNTINPAEPFLPDWTDNVNDCDGFKNIRWRILLVSNLISGTRARLNTVVLPVTDASN